MRQSTLILSGSAVSLSRAPWGRILRSLDGDIHFQALLDQVNGVDHVSRDVGISRTRRGLVLLRIWYIRTPRAQQVAQIILQCSSDALVGPWVIWLVLAPVLGRDRRDGVSEDHIFKQLVRPPRLQEGTAMVKAKLRIA